MGIYMYNNNENIDVGIESGNKNILIIAKKEKKDIIK